MMIVLLGEVEVFPLHGSLSERVNIMMRKVFRLFPVFIVIWLARKCEIISIDDSKWLVAFDDVLIRRSKRKAR